MYDAQSETDDASQFEDEDARKEQGNEDYEGYKNDTVLKLDE